MLLMRCILVACLLVAATTDTIDEGVEGCPQEAKAATAECQKNVVAMKAKADKVCKGRNYEDVMKKVRRLQKMAEAQEAALKKGESALKRFRAHAARLAKMSAAERKKLLAELGKQKAGKKKLSAAEKKAAAEDAKMKHLRGQADAALNEAVNVAKKTGDKAKVKAAKDKAHALYRKMVDEKIRVASVHHEVFSARAALGKIAKMVEKEIGAAKKVATKEAGALKKVAGERYKVAEHKLKGAEDKSSAASVAERSAERKQKGLVGKVGGIDSDIANGRATVKNAQNVKNAAAAAKEKVQKTKVKVGPLTMPAMTTLAKAIARGEKPMPSATHPMHTPKPHPTHHLKPHPMHNNAPKTATIKHSQSGGASHVHVYVHSHGVDQNTHNQYAAKVKHIEGERLKAKAIYHEAEAKLARLKKSGGDTTAAQNDVNTAAANLKKLVAAQHAAVTAAVNNVKGSGRL